MTRNRTTPEGQELGRHMARFADEAASSSVTGRSLDPYSIQHDLHCWLTFNGQDWKIEKIKTLANIVLVRQGADGLLVYGRVDLSHADLEAYCEAASTWIVGIGPMPKQNCRVAPPTTTEREAGDA